jgi:fatty-acyl-CoA synthase
MAIRRYGAPGGLVANTAARYGDAPTITDHAAPSAFATRRNVQRVGMVWWPKEFAYAAIAHRIATAATVSAANKIGVRTVLMNTGFAGPQLADVCAREHVSCILVDDEFEDILNMLPTETLRFTSSRLNELIDNQSTSSLPAPRQPGGMALLTSGTTGTRRVPRNRLTCHSPRSY